MIIGVDYSTKYVHFGWLPNQWRKLRVDEDLLAFTQGIANMLPEHEDGHLYLERPWARYNAWTGMQMQRIATIIDVVATQQGWNVHWTTIAAWRSKLWGKGKYASKEAKKMALAYVKEECGLDLTDDNAADAICLAIYGEMK